MNEKLITSGANPLIKKIKSLSQKKNRDEEKLFVVEGLRHVTDALVKGWEAETIFYAGPRPPLPATSAYLIETTEEMLSRMTGRENTQNVIGVFKHRWHPLADVIDGIWVALEGVRDPGNLGTIVRTAHASGATGVILIGQTCDPWSPEAIRASMGSFAYTSFVHADLTDLARWKKNFTGKIIGTDVTEASDYREISYTKPLVLLMGNESAGLTPEALSLCDATAKIPMAKGAESLNLSIATGLMLYEAYRQQDGTA